MCVVCVCLNFQIYTRVNNILIYHIYMCHWLQDQVGRCLPAFFSWWLQSISVNCSIYKIQLLSQLCTFSSCSPQGAKSEDLDKNLVKSASGLPIVLPLRLYFLSIPWTNTGGSQYKRQDGLDPSYLHKSCYIQYFTCTVD